MKPDVAKHSQTFPDNINSGLHIDDKNWQQTQSAALELINRSILG